MAQRWQETAPTTFTKIGRLLANHGVIGPSIAQWAFATLSSSCSLQSRLAWRPVRDVTRACTSDLFSHPAVDHLLPIQYSTLSSLYRRGPSDGLFQAAIGDAGVILHDRSESNCTQARLSLLLLRERVRQLITPMLLFPRNRAARLVWTCTAQPLLPLQQTLSHHDHPIPISSAGTCSRRRKSWPSD